MLDQYMPYSKQISIVENPESSNWDLRFVASTTEFNYIKEQIAIHPNCNRLLLAYLARSSNSDVRRAVALNAKVSLETIEHFTIEEDLYDVNLAHLFEGKALELYLSFWTGTNHINFKGTLKELISLLNITAE